MTSNRRRDGRTSVDLCPFMKPTARKLRPVADGASIHSLTPKKYISKNLGCWFKGEWKWISVVPQKAKMSQSHDQYNKVSRGPLSTETPSLGLNAHGVIGISKANIIFLQRSWSKSYWDATSHVGYAKPNQSAWQMVQVPCAFQHKWLWHAEEIRQQWKQ